MAYILKKEKIKDLEFSDNDLTLAMIENGINSTYNVIENINAKLLENGSPKISKLMELANLSAFVGNLAAGTIAKNSKGVFTRNRPHAYPDLLHKSGEASKNVEIKVALEKNKPKGHLPKEGNYLTFRYVLLNCEKKYIKGKENRGEDICIYEIKYGRLEKNDFDLSSTEGDSGKTAVIKTEVFKKMTTLYYDEDISPYVRVRRAQ